MDLGEITLSLMLGRLIAVPAPTEIMEALQSIDITRSDEGPSTFQISFNADRPGQLSVDYPIVMSPLLLTNNRVVVSVLVNYQPIVLMDGIITHTEFNQSGSSGSATFSITGEDVSVHMDVYEESMVYPALEIDEIVDLIVLKYAEYGLIPEVFPPMMPIIWEPEERSRIQNSTDRAFIQGLADLAGYVFRITPTLPMVNTAYFGPKVTMGLPTLPLNVNMGPATNVQDISFNYDSRQGTLVHGTVQDYELEEELDLPVETFGAIMVPPMATLDGTMMNQPYVRNVLYTDPTYDFSVAEMQAQMKTNRSAERIVSGQVTIDTFRYGEVITTPNFAYVRGAGYSYDGMYYVSQVQHSISLGKYTQQLTLSREGTGNTLPLCPTAAL